MPGEARLTLAKALPAADPGNLSSSGLGNWPSRKRANGPGAGGSSKQQQQKERQQVGKDALPGGAWVAAEEEGMGPSGLLKRAPGKGRSGPVGGAEKEGDDDDVLDLCVSDEEEEEQQQQQENRIDEGGALDSDPEVVDLTFEELVGSEYSEGRECDSPAAAGGGGRGMVGGDGRRGYVETADGAEGEEEEEDEDLLEALHRSVEEQQQQHDRVKGKGDKWQGGTQARGNEKGGALKGVTSSSLLISSLQQQDEIQGLGGVDSVGGATPPSSGKKRYTQPRLEEMLGFGVRGADRVGAQPQQQQQQGKQQQQTGESVQPGAGGASVAAFKELIEGLGLHSKSKKGEGGREGGMSWNAFVLQILTCCHYEIRSGFRQIVSLLNGVSRTLASLSVLMKVDPVQDRFQVH